MARVPAFQAGYAGSIPVTRSIHLCRVSTLQRGRRLRILRRLSFSVVVRE